MDEEHFKGTIALVIAVSLCLAIILGIGGLVWRDRQLSEGGRDALIAIGGTLVGIVAGYVGGRGGK
jgi:hypothetical protein